MLDTIESPSTDADLVAGRLEEPGEALIEPVDVLLVLTGELFPPGRDREVLGGGFRDLLLGDAGVQLLLHLRVHRVYQGGNPSEVALSRQDLAMSGDDGLDLQLRYASQRSDEIHREPAEEVRDRMIEEIACHEELLAGQVNYGIARRVAASEEADLHFAIAEIEPQLVLQD